MIVHGRLPKLTEHRIIAQLLVAGNFDHTDIRVLTSFPTGLVVPRTDIATSEFDSEKAAARGRDSYRRP
jgi:hypothetical protein